MYTILMDALCLDCYSDLLLNEEVNIEAAVESIVGVLLLDFFGEVIAIDGVRLVCVPATPGQPSQHWLQVQATSSGEEVDMPIDLLEIRLDEAVCCALLEHFHIVIINVIDVQLAAQ